MNPLLRAALLLNAARAPLSAFLHGTATVDNDRAEARALHPNLIFLNLDK